MILAGADREVAEWVQERYPLLELTTPFTAIGWCNEGKEIAAGVVYDNYTRINIDAHIALARTWMGREYLREIFRYPFVQLGVRRITARVAGGNARSQHFCKKLGFRSEGICREALPGGEDLFIFGMLKPECRWLEVGLHGQR